MEWPSPGHRLLSPVAPGKQGPPCLWVFLACSLLPGARLATSLPYRPCNESSTHFKRPPHTSPTFSQACLCSSTFFLPTISLSYFLLSALCDSISYLELCLFAAPSMSWLRRTVSSGSLQVWSALLCAVHTHFPPKLL